MEEINLETYNIYIGDIQEELMAFVDKHNYQRIFVLVDENTKEHCLPIFRKWISISDNHIIQIESGEQNKNIDTCQLIWSKMFQNQGGRKDLLINLGGGVIGDMGGFSASTFKRGIDFIQIPTTLLSQVDASIGGKLGVDFANLKNSIGLFSNPKAVFIHVDFLKTLDPRELKSGFAEMIKHCLIADKTQWAAFLEIEAATISNIHPYLKHSITIKRHVVDDDPFEKGVRKSLNFGHTIGHAVESYALAQNISLLHGEAVAIGIICESYLSWKYDRLNQDELEQIAQYVVKHFGKFDALKDFPREELKAFMLQDKKNEDHRINFTMLNGIGCALINQFVSFEEIMNSLTYYEKL